MGRTNSREPPCTPRAVSRYQAPCEPVRYSQTMCEAPWTQKRVRSPPRTSCEPVRVINGCQAPCEPVTYLPTVCESPCAPRQVVCQSPLVAPCYAPLATCGVDICGMDCRTTTRPGGLDVRFWVASHAYTSSKRSQVDVRMYTSLEYGTNLGLKVSWTRVRLHRASHCSL